MKEYISRNWIVLVDTEHDPAHIKQLGGEMACLTGIICCLIFQMVGLSDELQGWDLETSIHSCMSLVFSPKRSRCVLGASC